jgi:hypothetical protein
MTIRYYIVPIERVDLGRGPKYFKWRLGTGTITCQWAMVDYGQVDQAVVAADISDADHATLAAASDVMTLPVNLDANMTAGAVNTAQTWLESIGVPAGWINAGLTYREVLRTVTALFLFVQRVCAILGRAITITQAGLNTQFRNLPADVRAAITQAADEQGFNRTGISNTTTMRNILKLMADAWEDKPILFGFTSL